MDSIMRKHSMVDFKQCSRFLGQLSVAAVSAGLLLAGCSTTKSGTSVGSGGQMTLAEANERMIADGSMNNYVTTRNKLGRMTYPKYPEEAWNWFNERRVAIGETSLPKNYRQAAYTETLRGNMNKSALKVRSAAWRPIHPSGGVQPSGRLIELAVDPGNEQVVFAASASGGVWKTTDQGRNWANVTDGYLPTIGMGSISMDPNDSSIVYCGLGEGVPGAFYEPIGAGIYKSTDSGASWSLLGNSASMISNVTDIKVLNNSSTLLAASGGTRAAGGLYRSTDGGQNWSEISNVGNFSISVDPANRSNVLATSQYISLSQTTAIPGEIFFSTNAGQSFSAATIPDNSGVFRIELSRSGQIVYALAAGTDASIKGIWKSTNNGQTFTALPMTGIPTSGDYKPGQMYYNCAIGVSPYNSDIVYVGSNLRMYKSVNGGQSWTAASDWAGDDGLPYVHADHHSIRFGSNSDIVYFGTDGGFFVTTNGGTTWEERNINMTALQIYRMDNHATNENAVVMGLQDNDKYVRRTDGTWTHYPNSFGDAMEMLSWPPDPNVFFGANYFGGAVRVTEDGGSTQWPLIRGYQGSNNGIPDDERGAWISPFFYDPDNPSTLYLGLNGVYRTTYTKGVFPTWTQIIARDTTQTPNQLESMTITRGATNRKLIWFKGRRDQSGQLTVGINRANPDGTNLENVALPQLGWVSDIEADPNNNDTIWITYSNLAGGPQDNKRIFRSTNLGTSWTDMTNNFPAETPANTVMVDPGNSNTIFIGSDVGIFRSDNGGSSWTYWNEGLPPVVITDLAYFGPKRLIRAASYGRGMWESEIDEVTGAPSIRISPETLNFN